MEHPRLYANNLIAFKLLVQLLAVLLFLFVLPTSIFGQSRSLSIYPPVIEVDATPPSSPTVPIVIQNNNPDELRLEIRLIPFKPNNEKGDVILDPSLMERSFYKFYSDKIQILSEGEKIASITLQPLETREVILNVNLEKGDPPGDFYYSIVFVSEGNEPQDTSLSSIPAGIATNLLLSIGPKGKASGGITEFKTSFFKNSGPVEFSLNLHNASNHLILPQGEVIIESIFGKTMGKIEILPQYVLSKSNRYLLDVDQASGSARLSYNNKNYIPKIVWKEPFLMGIYKATAKIQLEENGRTIDASTYFMAFPLYLFVGIIVIVFVSLSIYLRVRRKI